MTNSRKFVHVGKKKLKKGRKCFTWWNFEVKTKEIYKSMSSVVRRWKVFAWEESYIRKLEKLLKETINCWLKVKKVVHVGMKSYRRVEKLYFDETFYEKTKNLQVLLEDGKVFIW